MHNLKVTEVKTFEELMDIARKHRVVIVPMQDPIGKVFYSVIVGGTQYINYERNS